jgi:iron-sulfur cluster assembly protein
MAITLTETAAREVSKIIDEQQDPSRNGGQEPRKLYLRVGVKGGGCSGFSYSLDLTETKREDDETWDMHGVEVVCDPKSHLYLNGTTVDFRDEIMGRGFVFNNPNATNTCGCGSSFQA